MDLVYSYFLLTFDSFISVCTHMCACVYLMAHVWKSKGDFQESSLSFHLVHARICPQIIGLGSVCLSLLSQQPSLLLPILTHASTRMHTCQVLC